MNEKSWLVLRIVAGLYVIYLGYQLVKGMLTERPGNMVFMMTAGILFIIIGAIIVIISIKGMAALKNKMDTEADDPADGEEIPAEEDEMDSKDEDAEEAALEDHSKENNNIETAEDIEDDTDGNAVENKDDGTVEDSVENTEVNTEVDISEDAPEEMIEETDEEEK